MTKTLLLTLPALALALAATPAAAQQRLAPGLWEMKMSTAGGPDLSAAMARAREQMAQMPPEQRKMMEEMMAKQGVAMPGGPGGGIRFCLGKDQAERGDVPQDNDGRCKREITERSGSLVRFKFSCTEPPSSGSGEMSFTGDKAYAMKMKATTTLDGQTRTTEMTQTATWLSADCGSLKPRQGPAR